MWWCCELLAVSVSAIVINQMRPDLNQGVERMAAEAE